MNGLLDRLFNISRYSSRADKDQARLVSSFVLIMMAIFFFFALFVDVGANDRPLFSELGTNPLALIPVLGVFGVGTVSLVLTRSGRLEMAAVGPVVMWLLSGVLLALQNRFLFSDAGASLIFLIVLSALFLRGRGLVYGTALALGILLIGVVTFDGYLISSENYFSNTVDLVLELIGASILIYLFLRSTRLDQTESEVRANQDRFTLANVTTQIAQRISRRIALADLLSSSVEDIRNSYSDIYHAQIFLINEKTREAELVASTGDIGRMLLGRRHSLTVGSQSVIGTVTSAGDLVIARAGSSEGIHRRNEFLPDTVVEAAYPLKIGATVIGALDLQSRVQGAFSDEEVPIFQSLADNIAVAIDNARLFEQTEQRLQENQRLIEQMRSAVREVERLNRELTQQVWTEYLGSKSSQLSVDLDFSNNLVRRTDDWTPTLNEAMTSNQVVQKSTRDGVIVSVPLRVRGLVIGAMEFELAGEVLAAEDVDLVEAVAERLGLAVESTRLFDESRRVAQREINAQRDRQPVAAHQQHRFGADGSGAWLAEFAGCEQSRHPARPAAENRRRSKRRGLMISAHGDELSQIRFHYVRALAIAGVALLAVGLVTGLLGFMQQNLAVQIVAMGLCVVWLFLATRGQIRIASYGLLVTLILLAVVNPISERSVLIGTLVVLTAAILARRELYLVANLIVIGKLSLEMIRLVVAHPGTIPPNLATYMFGLITIGAVSLVARFFINSAQNVVATSRLNADLLQATSDVGQVISQILNQDELVERAVNLMATRFNHYHVQIFLVNDTRDQAVLVASTGETGKRLLSRGHQLSVGSQSVIGQVVLRGAAVLVSDTEHDPIYYHNELLPNTRAELALPIRDSNQTIGALDIQSVYHDAFSKADIQALQIMADLLATVIRNARLFKQQAETVQENDRLYRDAAGNLREIERLNQQLTRMAWQDYHTDTNAVSGVTLERDQLLPSGEWSDSLIRAGLEGGQVIEDDGDWDGNHKTVAVPVMLRGEVIGAIEVEQGMENNPETLEMVQAVAQRLALSLENARLYEATLQAAAQEQRINDIAARFQSVATVDELLRITLAELSETLGAERGSIRLGRFTLPDTGPLPALESAEQDGVTPNE